MEKTLVRENPPAPRPETLSGAQKRRLRALGHGLSPTVRVGKAGFTDNLVKATRQALQDHELIKIAITNDCPINRKIAPKELATLSGSHVAQIIGRTALLYRERKKNPEIKLPQPKSDAGGDTPDQAR